MVLFILYSHFPDEGSETQETSTSPLAVPVRPYIFIPSLIYPLCLYYLLPILSLFLILYLVYPLIIYMESDNRY